MWLLVTLVMVESRHWDQSENARPQEVHCTDTQRTRLLLDEDWTLFRQGLLSLNCSFSLNPHTLSVVEGLVWCCMIIRSLFLYDNRFEKERNGYLCFRPPLEPQKLDLMSFDITPKVQKSRHDAGLLSLRSKFSFLSVVPSVASLFAGLCAGGAKGLHECAACLSLCRIELIMGPQRDHPLCDPVFARGRWHWRRHRAREAEEAVSPVSLHKAAKEMRSLE